MDTSFPEFFCSPRHLLFAFARLSSVPLFPAFSRLFCFHLEVPFSLYCSVSSEAAVLVNLYVQPKFAFSSAVAASRFSFPRLELLFLRRPARARSAVDDLFHVGYLSPFFRRQCPLITQKLLPFPNILLMVQTSNTVAGPPRILRSGVIRVLQTNRSGFRLEILLETNPPLKSSGGEAQIIRRMRSTPLKYMPLVRCGNKNWMRN